MGIEYCIYCFRTDMFQNIAMHTGMHGLSTSRPTLTKTNIYLRARNFTSPIEQKLWILANREFRFAEIFNFASTQNSSLIALKLKFVRRILQ